MASFSETRGVAVSTERVSQPVVPDGIVEISYATFADMLLQGQISIATFADMLVQGQLHFRTPHNQKTVTDTTRLRVVLDGDVAFIRGCVYDFFDGTTPSDNPFERVRFVERDVEPANTTYAPSEHYFGPKLAGKNRHVGGPGSPYYIPFKSAGLV